MTEIDPSEIFKIPGKATNGNLVWKPIKCDNCKQDTHRPDVFGKKVVCPKCMKAAGLYA